MGKEEDYEAMKAEAYAAMEAEAYAAMITECLAEEMEEAEPVEETGNRRRGHSDWCECIDCDLRRYYGETE